MDTGRGFVADFNNYDSSVLGPSGLFLGTFDSGETFEFKTTLKVELSTLGLEVGGSASIGDPGDITGQGLSGTITSAPPLGAIPEPSALAVWSSLGLIFVGLRMRQKRQLLL